MKNPFGPGGEFAKNIRSITGDDTELRESLKSFGWVPEFPALVDENGVVLVGNRRMKIAKELKIEAIVETVNCGKGDAADARRFKLAIASNVGFQQMSPEDRKRIATHLYGTQEWTMQKIAEALGVAKGTVSKDLKGIVSNGNNSKTGAGRPKSNLQPTRRMNTTPKAEAAAKAVLDQGKTYPEVSAATGFSSTVLRSAIAREEGRREALADPVVKPEDLSATAQQKLEAAVRQYKKQLDLDFEERVRTTVLDRTKERLAYFTKREDHYNQVVKAHRGFMSEATYKLILRCLHPDSRESVSDRIMQDAFAAWTKLKIALVPVEPTSLAPPPGWPTSPTDLAKRREEVKQARRSKQANKGVVRPNIIG